MIPHFQAYRVGIAVNLRLLKSHLINKTTSPRQQEVWCRDPSFLSLKALYRFRVGNRAVAYSALYHNSFILGHSCSRNVAWDICRRRESDIRARVQTNPIHQSLPNSALALGKIIELIGLVSGFDEG